MSPFGAVTTADGALNSSVPLPGVPALPRVISSLPSGLNLKTWWPLPLRPRPSVTHTLPSRSTCRPCGNRIRPEPKLEQPARRIEFEDRIERRFGAGERRARIDLRRWPRFAAALANPHAGAVGVDRDGAGRPPRPGTGDASPALDR